MSRTPIHPGEHLAEELREAGLTAAEALAPDRCAGQSHHGHYSRPVVLTADTALRLGHWFGTAPQFWMNLQQLYELRLAESEVGAKIAHCPSGRPVERPAQPVMSRRVKKPLKPRGDRPKGARPYRGSQAERSQAHPPRRQAGCAVRCLGAPRGQTTAFECPTPPNRSEPPPLRQVQTVVVTADDPVDRFLAARFPGPVALPHPAHRPQRRIAGERQARRQQGPAGGGAKRRIPPLKLDAPKVAGHLSEAGAKTLAALKDMILLWRTPTSWC